MSRARRPAVARPDPLGAIVLGLAGILLVVLAAVGASSQDAVAPQLTYLNVGIGGVVLAGTGDVVLLLGLRRAVRRRQLELARHPRLAELMGPRAIDHGARP